MPLPFENTALRTSLKLKIEEWITQYGAIPIVTIIKTILDEKAAYVSKYTSQASAASASASWSSSSTNCSTFLTGIYVGATAF